jgi:NAD(P)-dependent dehydrogenase (short-subunit alcohol dehydrogenase family)
VGAYLRSMRVDDQVAVVTGASQGLGRAIALALAEAGAHVAVADLPEKLPRAAEVAGLARSAGRSAEALPLDVLRLDSIRAMVDQALDTFGRIDVLVNNAGIQITRDAGEFTEAEWDAVVDVDLKGVFFCSQTVGRHMVRRGQGCIVNVASINGLIGYHRRAAYCSAKGGVVNLTRALAVEWASAGVRVNAVAPQYVRTALTEKTLSDPETAADILRRVPLGRLAEPEDVAAAVVFLASPAAGMITGHTLPVDGGWLAW